MLSADENIARCCVRPEEWVKPRFNGVQSLVYVKAADEGLWGAEKVSM